MTEDKNTCWYQQSCVDEMNRFFDLYIKDHDVRKHLSGFTTLLDLTDEKGSEILDLGTGTAMISEFCKNYKFVGCDLPHILAGCAMRNYPQYFYRACDMVHDDLSWTRKYPVLIVNGVIDIMEFPLEMLSKVLQNTSKFLLIHRQEITEAGETRVIRNGSYGGYTYHSIISRKDLNELLERENFYIVKEVNLEFGNWENGGTSLLLRKKNVWSINNIDHKLKKYFNGKENGFFIEVGANDGLSQSNTMFFEYYYNWRGILIEPIKELWDRCVQNRSNKNHYVNTALVAHDYQSETIELVYSPESNGLLSVVNRDVSVDNIKKMHGENISYQICRAQTFNKVLSTALNMDSNLFKKIDLLVIDVEGYEKEVLMGLDLSRWDIDYILVEELDENEDVANILRPYFHRIEKLSEHDYLYKNKKLV